MGSADQVNVVLFCKFADYFFTEGKADAAVIVAPVGGCFVGVRPQQIAEQARIRHIRGTHDIVDRQNSIELR